MGLMAYRINKLLTIKLALIGPEVSEKKIFDKTVIYKSYVVPGQEQLTPWDLCFSKKIVCCFWTFDASFSH